MQEIVRFTDQPLAFVDIAREGSAPQKRLRGTAAVFFNGSPGTEYQLTPTIKERIAKGAFTEALRNADVYAAINHTKESRFARTPKTLTLWQDEAGLHYEAAIRETTIVRDLMADIQDEIIRGSSFRGIVNFGDKTSHEWSKEGGMKILTIKRFEKLVDVSAVDNAAYKDTSLSVIQRSADDWELWAETLKRIEVARQIS